MNIGHMDNVDEWGMLAYFFSGMEGDEEDDDVENLLIFRLLSSIGDQVVGCSKKCG